MDLTIKQQLPDVNLLKVCVVQWLEAHAQRPQRAWFKTRCVTLLIGFKTQGTSKSIYPKYINKATAGLCIRNTELI